MDITGSSDPYVKIKLLDAKGNYKWLRPNITYVFCAGKRIGKKKKTSVKNANLNPYFNESFVFIVEEHLLTKVARFKSRFYFTVNCLTQTPTGYSRTDRVGL